MIDIRQRLVDLGLVVSGLDYPWINYYRIPGYNSRYVVWLNKDGIEVVKDLYILNWSCGETITNTIISTSTAIKYYDFFEAEKQIKKIIVRYKELQLELKQEKIREKLKDLEKDFENE